MPQNYSYDKPEYRELMSKIKKGVSVNVGSNNPMFGKFRELNSNWKGGFKISEGYKLILKTDHPNNIQGYVLEHRLIMEKHLGRYIRSDEIVHHINEDKLDNRIENLQIVTRAEHVRIHKIGKKQKKEKKR